jgi:hypothetical protein
LPLFARQTSGRLVGTISAIITVMMHTINVIRGRLIGSTQFVDLSFERSPHGRLAAFADGHRAYRPRVGTW